MGRIFRLIEKLVTLKRLGGGSVWQGVAYVGAGALAVLFLLMILPFLAMMLLPDWLVTLVGLLIVLPLVGGLVYVGAASYKKVRAVYDSIK